MIFWCKNCLNASTRPRITFDSRGWCNACQWHEQKKKINWQAREEELSNLLDYCKNNSQGFDCLVPVSGGKDGSYVAYQLKEKYGMNPLTVTIRPALSLELGDKNLNNFIQTGFSHVHISPDPNIMQQLNKIGFVEKGFPYYGWLIAILTSVVRTAVNYEIPLIFYGEDGEVEYGGNNSTESSAIFDVEYMKNIYLEGGHQRVLSLLANVTQAELYDWTFPSEQKLANADVRFTHWSYFEPWDSYRNYLVAKENCGLKESELGNSGTFTNFAQNDQALYSLHTYLMYLKFGFGRATQDAGIEIRRGAMQRDQAVNLVRLYDNCYPSQYIDQYLEYYQITKKEFNNVIDKWANKSLFEKKNDRWSPTFVVI